MAIRKKYKPTKVLAGWREVNRKLPEMNEQELLAALEKESDRPSGEKRRDIILRLHRRFTKVRQERELEEYLQ